MTIRLAIRPTTFPWQLVAVGVIYTSWRMSVGMSRPESESLVLLFVQLCLTTSAEIMKSKFVRRPSSVSQLSLYLMRGFLLNFSRCFPWARAMFSDVVGEKTHFPFVSPAWLRQQSSWNRNIRPSPVGRFPSAVCGIDYLWAYCMDFFQILDAGCPGPNPRSFFLI